MRWILLYVFIIRKKSTQKSNLKINSLFNTVWVSSKHHVVVYIHETHWKDHATASLLICILQCYCCQFFAMHHLHMTTRQQNHCNFFQIWIVLKLSSSVTTHNHQTIANVNNIFLNMHTEKQSAFQQWVKVLNYLQLYSNEWNQT